MPSGNNRVYRYGQAVYWCKPPALGETQATKSQIKVLIHRNHTGGNLVSRRNRQNCIQTYPTVFRHTPLCSDLSLCVQAYPSVLRPTPLCSDLSLYVQTYPTVFRPTPLCSDLPLCVQTYPSVFRPIPLCSDLPHCVQTYSRFKRDIRIFSRREPG